MRDMIYSVLTAIAQLSTAVLFMLKLAGRVATLWQVFIPTFIAVGIIIVTELAILVKKLVKLTVYKHKRR